jgi:hypothetical protein
MPAQTSTVERAGAEMERLAEARARGVLWRKWGPYLSERQWGTVREDYSDDGNTWNSFSHDQARSRAYHWSEDGLAGFSDDKQQLCFALALWNGRDTILKERLFGLTNSEGHHGEDVKEYDFSLDATPTHSSMKDLYKYPQAAYPYTDLIETNRRRSRGDLEYELMDTGIFHGDMRCYCTLHLRAGYQFFVPFFSIARSRNACLLPYCYGLTTSYPSLSTSSTARTAQALSASARLWVVTLRWRSGPCEGPAHQTTSGCAGGYVWRSLAGSTQQRSAYVVCTIVTRRQRAEADIACRGPAAATAPRTACAHPFAASLLRRGRPRLHRADDHARSRSRGEACSPDAAA